MTESERRRPLLADAEITRRLNRVTGCCHFNENGWCLDCVDEQGQHTGRDLSNYCTLAHVAADAAPAALPDTRADPPPERSNLSLRLCAEQIAQHIDRERPKLFDACISAGPWAPTLRELAARIAALDTTRAALCRVLLEPEMPQTDEALLQAAHNVVANEAFYRERVDTERYVSLRTAARAMRKVLPPVLLAEVLAYVDPLTPFVDFLRAMEEPPP